MAFIMQGILKVAEKCADVIKKFDEILVVSHIDADGLTSAGIMKKALLRCDIEPEMKFLRQLDARSLEEMANTGRDAIIFTDLGSGSIDLITNYDFEPIIVDHHQIKGETKYHLNPHLFGIDGSFELCGAGSAYLLAQGLGENKDLADLAIVGAVGDLQHRKKGKLVSENRKILEIGCDLGVLNYKKDIKLFGRQTRPIYMLLQYSSDPYLPGLTGNEHACINFLQGLGISLKDETWRFWVDLSKEEKQLIVSNLIQYCLSKGMDERSIERLVGEVYTLPREEERTEIRDASEYSTLLNATARYDFAEVGLAVCMGDRNGALKEAKNLLVNHRRNLVNGLLFVKDNGVEKMEHLQYFYAGKQIRETIVGIIAGMSLSTCNRSIPIIGIVDSDDGLKISSRATQALVRRGLNLGFAISESAEHVGGVGGGHDIAAGATIPKDSLDEFLGQLNQRIGIQLNA